MLVHRRRRCTSITPTLGQRLANQAATCTHRYGAAARVQIPASRSCSWTRRANGATRRPRIAHRNPGRYSERVCARTSQKNSATRREIANADREFDARNISRSSVPQSNKRAGFGSAPATAGRPILVECDACIPRVDPTPAPCGTPLCRNPYCHCDRPVTGWGWGLLQAFLPEFFANSSFLIIISYLSESMKSVKN